MTTDLKETGKSVPVTVVIPTYGREEVLLDTIGMFLAQQLRGRELLVLDQTEQHQPKTDKRLRELDEQGDIRWLRLEHPSQPGALNKALLEATQPVVLFLDDDIRIDQSFVVAHARHYDDEEVWAVAGQVLQPGEKTLEEFVHRPSTGAFADCNFPFRSAIGTWIENGMSGNLSVRRDKAIQIGGFDENFLPPVSYRFDNEFCKRLVQAGGKIRFEPSARIYHLRAERGGTRSLGGHMTSASPMHGSGDYYFALRQGLNPTTLAYILRRPFREVRTRFHLRHPWWIPVKLIGEFRALLQAVRLHMRGPKYLRISSRQT